MDVAILISVGVLFVLFFLVVKFVRDRDHIWDQKIVLGCEKEMEKRCKALSQKMELMEAEWGQIYTKFTRLHSRSLRFAQEDEGNIRGGPGKQPPNGPLTREEVRRIVATGSWRTSSPPPSARPSPE
jgi:hypothetical protein